MDSGGLGKGGLMCRLVVAEGVGFRGIVATASRSVVCVRLNFRDGCWRELHRSLSSLTPSPSPQPPKHGVLPPQTTATSVHLKEFEINVPLRETVGAIKVLATFRVASLETAATALRAPWRERRSVVRPEIRQLTTGGRWAIETYRSSGEGREHLGSLYGAQLAGTEMRCQVAAGRGQKRGGGRIC